MLFFYVSPLLLIHADIKWETCDDKELVSTSSEEDDFQYLVDEICSKPRYKLSCTNTIESLSEWNVEKRFAACLPTSGIEVERGLHLE